MKSNRNKMISRIFVILVCSLLLFVAVLNCYSKKVHAEPISIGLGLAAVISSFFAAGGITLATQNITNNQSYASKIEDIANQYSAETNSPQIYQWQGDMKFLYSDEAGDAFVTVSDTFANWLNGFRSWFVTNFALTDSGETIIFSEDKLNFMSGSYPYYPSSSVFVDGKVPVSAVPIVPDSTQLITIDDRYTINVLFGEPYDYYGHRMRVEIKLFDGASQIGSFVHIYASGADQSFDFIKIYFSQYNGSLAIKMAPDDWGGYTVDNYGFTLPLSISSLDLESIGLTGSLTDGYADFEQALEDAKTDAGENGRIGIGVGDVAVDRPVTQEGIANGILDNVITGTAEGTLVGGYTDDKEAEEENNATVAPSEDWFAGNMIVVDGLEDFFPFCIPFDFYEIIRRLNVTPEAPKFNWKMNFGDTGLDDYDIEIDLAPYETVAIVFRIMFIIGFLVFLTIKTRDLIRG